MKKGSLYVITGEMYHKNRSVETVIEEALQGGADIVQLRDKTHSKREILRKARHLRTVTKRYNVPFIINDHLDIAMAVDADGVHLGQDDVPLNVAKDLLGPSKQIGISTKTLEEALEAEEQGADYIGVGPIFSTKTKADAPEPLTPDFIAFIQNRVSIPVVPIGGITRENAPYLLDVGATSLCVIGDVMGATNVTESAMQFKELLNRYETEEVSR